MNIDNKNVAFFGSSAGGFMSIMYSIMIKDTVAIANNPQIWVRKETQESRAINLYNNVFPNMTESEITDRYGDRLSIIKKIEKENYIPKIYYILNRYSEKDVKQQYNVFIEFLDNLNDLDNDIEIISYHSSNGHNGIYSREQTVQFINGYFSRNEKFNSHSLSKSNKRSFQIYNDINQVLEQKPFNDVIYLPIENIIKNYYSSYTFYFGLKKGTIELNLFSKYYNFNNPNNLFYEIFVNDKKVLSEDMAKWRFENFVTLNNLDLNTKVEIRVITVKNNSLKSWSDASRLEVISVKEVFSNTISDENVTCTSPYSRIF